MGDAASNSGQGRGGGTAGFGNNQDPTAGAPVLGDTNGFSAPIPIYGGTQLGTNPALSKGANGITMPQYGGVGGGADNASSQLSSTGADFGAGKYGAPPNLYTPGVAAAWGTNGQAQGISADAIRSLGDQAAGKGPSAAGLGQAANLSSTLGNSYAASKLGPATGAMMGNAGAATGAIGAGGAARSGELTSANAAYQGALNTQAGQGNAAQRSANDFALQQAGDTQKGLANNSAMDLYYQQQAQQVQAQQLAANQSMYNFDLGNAAQLGAQTIGQNATFNSNAIGAGHSAPNRGTTGWEVGCAATGCRCPMPNGKSSFFFQ